MWIVNYQDFRTQDSTPTKPPILRECYPAEIEATNRKTELQSHGLTVCITKMSAPRAKKAVKREKKSPRQTHINEHLNVSGTFNANWRSRKLEDW